MLQLPICDIALRVRQCCCISGSLNAAGEGTPTAEAKCAQQAIKLLSEFLSGCNRPTLAKIQSQSSGQRSNLSFPSPAPTMASAAMGKGSSPTGASAVSLPFKRSSMSPASSSMPSEPSSQQQANLGNANRPATTSSKDSSSSRISATLQVQRQLPGTGAVVSNGPSEQMTKASHASNPSASRREEALQTGSAAEGVQHAALPNTLKHDLSSLAGHHALGTQCVDMWHQSCSLLFPQVGQIS